MTACAAKENGNVVLAFTPGPLEIASAPLKIRMSMDETRDFAEKIISACGGLAELAFGKNRWPSESVFQPTVP